MRSLNSCRARWLGTPSSGARSCRARPVRARARGLAIERADHRSHLLKAVVSFLLGLLLPVAWAQGPAHAQGYPQPSGLGGFLQDLFGAGQSPTQASAPSLSPAYPSGPAAAFARSLHPLPVQSQTPLTSRPGRDPSRNSLSLAPPDRSARTPRNAASSLGGGLRTMCVRLCDGYYWPMTFDAHRSRLDHDAKVCSASCASEARAFVMPKSGEAKDMVDVQGRPYVKLVNAFRYRKEATDACRCRPEPWQSEARARHEGFAVKSGASIVVDAGAAPAPVEPAVTAAKGDAKAQGVTLADADALALSGGMAEPGSGGPASIRFVQAAAAKAGDNSPDKTPRGDNSKGAGRGVEVIPQRPKVAVLARSRWPHVPLSPVRVYVPATFVRQPYVIGQPQGSAYRTY